jgi:hypothetical protein
MEMNKTKTINPRIDFRSEKSIILITVALALVSMAIGLAGAYAMDGYMNERGKKPASAELLQATSPCVKDVLLHKFSNTHLILNSEMRQAQVACFDRSEQVIAQQEALKSWK